MYRLFLLVLVLGVMGLLPSCQNGPQPAGATTETEKADSLPETQPKVLVADTGQGFEVLLLDPTQASPRKELKSKKGELELKVNYGSPNVKGRKVWGELVPMDEVWRTGANEATMIEISKDVMVEGKMLPAGKYSLFTLPSANQWTIIFNKKAEQWGHYDYDAKEDALRVTVTPQLVDQHSEAMEFLMEGDMIVLRWEKMKVAFKVILPA